MKPVYIRRSQVMTILGISERTFRKLVNANKLNPVRFVNENEQPYYKVAEVENLKEGNQHGIR